MRTVASVIDLDQFRELGFVKLDRAVPQEVAAQIRAFAEEVVPPDGSPWCLGQATVYDFAPLVAAISPAVKDAFNSILGSGAWFVDSNWGFPTRFPGPIQLGWHIDGNWFQHHIDSGDQVLSPLYLWQDVGDEDGPTLLVPGSQKRVAQLIIELEPEGLPGPAHLQSVHSLIDGSDAMPATGRAGDVYLFHPLLAHSINPDGPPSGRRVVSNVCVHGRQRRRLDELPWAY